MDLSKSDETMKVKEFLMLKLSRILGHNNGTTTISVQQL